MYKENNKVGEENGANRNQPATKKNQPAGLQGDNKCCEHKLDVFD